MNPVSIRLLSQQLCSPLFSDPADLVSYMGAMQAQEYRMMRWAVAMRTRRPSVKAFQTAFDEGRIVRLHLMRGTWQLVSAEDYWWMLGLCAPKGIAVTRGWMASNRITIPDEELMRVRDILAGTAAERGSITKEDIVHALAARDIPMDDHRLSYHIRMAEYEGVLCSGDLLPAKATYALSERKVGPRVTMDRDEALARFAGKYFQSHQPATLADFVWWSGLNAGDCRKAVALLGDEIRPERWKGYEFYLLDGCRTRGFRRGESLLVPPYDEYLIGYKSRELVLDPQFSHHAHNNTGIFQPVIARDGVICGNWSPFRKDPECRFFVGEHVPEDCEKEWKRYCRFLRG